MTAWGNYIDSEINYKEVPHKEINEIQPDLRTSAIVFSTCDRGPALCTMYCVRVL